jgi:hypothetical protein
MKQILIIIPFILTVIFCQAQYNKEKLTDILTGGGTKAWTVKGASSEKSYSFNKEFSVAITKSDGSSITEKWALSSTDNIRWFISIGSQKHELIVSYDKEGSQFVKLTNQSGDKGSVYHETLLYPAK